MRAADTRLRADTTGSADVTCAPDIRQDRVRPAVMFRHPYMVIRDVRFPRRRELALAWNVVRQRGDDLFTVLCLGAVGIYFLVCRPGNRPALALCGVPLTHGRAAAWFDRHPVHFAAPDALW